jgi:Flp pilus assembly protein TadG
MNNKHTKTNITKRRGNATLEFALSALLIMTLLTVTFRFGYSFYTYNKLEGAVAAGARFASRLTYDSATATPSQTYELAVSNLVVYGSPSGGLQPLVPGLSPSNVRLTVNLENGVPKYTRVAIVNFDLSGPQAWRLNGKPFAEFRYMGRFAP